MTNAPQRILVVPPLNRTDSCVASGCAEALETLGHLVSVFDVEPWVPMCSALRELTVGLEHQEKLNAQGMALISGAVAAVANAQEVDVVLGFWGSPITASTRKDLQNQSVHTVCWMTNECNSFPFWRKMIEGYDIVATIEHEPFISELSVLGHTPIYLPFAAKRICKTPVSTHTAAEDMIVVLGDASDELANALVRHIERGIVVWGDGWENYEQFVPYYQGKLSSLTRSQRKALYRDAAIIVNIHSKNIGSGDVVNMETFAIASCGGFQLVDTCTLMEGMFSYDELVIFESAEELSEQLAEFVDDRDARLEYVRNAQKLVLSKHTYEHRMQKLLDVLLAPE